VEENAQTTRPDGIEATPAPLPPRRPVVPAAPPSLGGVLRAVLFAAVSIAALLLAGRRWADAYSRYRAFHSFDPAPLLAPAEEPLPPLPAPAETAPKQPRDVVFRLEAPSAKSVLLGGSFNAFDARNAALTRRGAGPWEITLSLPPGRYLYKFKVDGRWVLDPANPEKIAGDREASVLNIQ
jgi:hypothetical protein